MKNPCKKRFLQKIKDSDVYATVDDVAPTASSKERKKKKTKWLEIKERWARNRKRRYKFLILFNEDSGNVTGQFR